MALILPYGAHPTTLRRRVLPLGAGITATLGALVGVAAWNPDRSHIPLCPFRAVTGLDCPLCGGLRATHDALHLHLGGAADHNLLLVCAVPVLAVVWLRRRITPSRSTQLRARLTWVIVAAVVVAGFWIARDLPIPALHWLRSGPA